MIASRAFGRVFRAVGGSGAMIALLALTACGEDKPPVTPPSGPIGVSPQVEATPAPKPVAPAAPKKSLAEMQQENLVAGMEALNGHDPKKFAALYAEDATIVSAGLRQLDGRDAIAKDMQEWFDTFGDVKVGVQRAWIKGDAAVVEWVLNGVYKGGGLFGEKGKDTPIGHHGISVLLFNSDGQVKSEHRYGDLGTVAAQLGGGKAKAPPIPSVPAEPELVISKGVPEEEKVAAVGAAVMGSINDHSEAKFADLVTDDIEQTGLTTLAPTKGKADAKKFFEAVDKAFPDAKVTTTAAWAIGDYALVEYTLAGTHKGPLGAIPASKKPVTIHAVDVFKVRDGKVARAWTFTNGLELLSQIQTVPVPPGDK